MAGDPNAVVRRRGVTRNPAKRQLDAILKDVQADQPPLDLLHITETGWAEEILRSGQIECRNCSVFEGERLAYFFVGRPAYRPKEGDRKSDNLAVFPFAFIIDQQALLQPFHVYPFDTGAACSGRIQGACQPGVYLEDYELTADLKSAEKLIAWAFGSNLAYFQGQPRSGLGQDVKPWELAATGYVRISTSAASSVDAPDRRASTIEVASNQNVQLKNQCKIVIIPDRFLESTKGSRNESFESKLTSLGIKARTYQWKPNFTPDDHMEEVESIVHSYFLEKGSFK